MPTSFLSRLPLSRFEIDRDYLAREREGLFDELWADPATRILPIFQGTALLSSPTSLALLPVDAVPAPGLRVYLGRSTSTTSPEPAGTPIVAVQLEDAGHLAESEWANLRSVGSVLSDRDAGIFTEALGILNWHASHRFSPRTGEPTVPEKGGWVRRDPVSDTQVAIQGFTQSVALLDSLDADLTDAGQAALALVDAMNRTPSAIPGSTVEAVHELLTPAQAVEVVLDAATSSVDRIPAALA